MKVLERVSNLVTERNCLILLVSLFIFLSFVVALVPYDPSTDKADATTNDIWIEQYGHGVYHIPYDDWTFGLTQSVVVEYKGEYVVVNEKGPGHVFAILPFKAMGMEFLFGPCMVGLAVLGTFMLGKRLLCWQVGFIASLFVLFNLVVIVMCHRFYWTDASTMHFLVLALWLLVEGNYRYNGRSLDSCKAESAPPRDRFIGMIFCILSGLAFGASVSTRYPTGLLIVVFLLYLIGFYLLRVWPTLKLKNLRKALKDGMPFFFLLAAFTIGLLIVLVPLTQYNSTYFGGPFNSGYDATTLMNFNRTETLDVRNTSSVWTDSIGSYVSTAFGNLGLLLPTFLNRMPALVLLPLGVYCLRKRKLELAFLLLWVGINFYTYLSLEWVDMYARTQLVPWEPRYWLPSLPAIAIIGAMGIYGLANWIAKKMAHNYQWPDFKGRATKILISTAIVGALVLWTAVPAANYLNNPLIEQGSQPPQNPQVRIVTTDMLLAAPHDYVHSPVMLEDVIVTRISNTSIFVRSQNSSRPGSVNVQPVDWPSGTLPDFQVGQHLVLRGMFNVGQSPPGVPPNIVIGVKYGTQDFVRIMP